MKNNPVAKGLQFEELIVEVLAMSGLQAWRTNVTNPADPEKYKHGFDGGIDIIAKFSHKGKTYKEYTFYIQCKNHKEQLTKSAISEAYAGMHARGGFADNSIPVVIANTTATQETIQYAKDLGVELILSDDLALINEVKRTHKVEYGYYGVLMKAILFYHTQDQIWFNTLPDNKSNLSITSMTEQYLEASKVDFDQAQSYLDSASSLERRAEVARQKALDIQKVAVMRSIQATCNFKEKTAKKKSQANDLDGG